MSTLSHDRAGKSRRIDWVAYRDQRAYLSELYPLCFTPNGSTTKRPLASGIRHEMIAARLALSEPEIKNFLAAYTFGPKYLSAMRAGATRVNLHGEHDGSVASGEADHAIFSLRSHYAGRAKRRARREADAAMVLRRAA